MQEIVNQINTILSTMDIPRARVLVDSKDVGNIKWLLRNLQIRNRAHPKSKEVLQLLKVLGKNWEKGRSC